MMPTLQHIALKLSEASGHKYTAADVAAAARARDLRPVDGRLDEDAIPQVAYELNVMRKAGILPSAPYGLSDDIFIGQRQAARDAAVDHPELFHGDPAHGEIGPMK